jgi:hypothetical protein
MLFVRLRTGTLLLVRIVQNCVKSGGPVSVSERHTASDGSMDQKLVFVARNKPSDCDDNSANGTGRETLERPTRLARVSTLVLSSAEHVAVVATAHTTSDGNIITSGVRRQEQADRQ